MPSNDASTSSISNWLEMRWFYKLACKICKDTNTHVLGDELHKASVSGCLLIEDEWDFQEFSFMGCPANPDAIMLNNPKWCIVISEEW